MRIIMLAFLLNNFLSVQGQQSYPDSVICSNHIYNDKIKTVQLYREGWNLSYPLMKLNNDEKLIFGFDLVSNQVETYSYTFIHCDKDWKKSDIFPNDYLDGYIENPLEDYQASFNT